MIDQVPSALQFSHSDESFHTIQTKEEVAGTLEAVQTIQSITQALQKSKENYNAKCVEQERLKKEGATQREIEKVIVIKIISLWFQSTFKQRLHLIRRHSRMISY